MDYIKLGTRYYRDPAILAANERTGGLAEVLFLRGLAQCGADETEGHITKASLSFLGVRNAPRIAAVLVDEKLWEEIPDGWRVRSWVKWQSEHDALARRRKADRERQSRRRKGFSGKPPPDGGARDRPRDSRRDGPRDTSRDESRDVTPPRGEGEERRTQLPTDVASGDAREHEHSIAGSITAAYAAGVPLSDHGRALRTIAAALDAGYTPDLVRRGVGRLIAEQRTCTPDALRIAITADDQPPAGQPPRRRTATEKANGWLTVGLDDQDERPALRALPGGAG